MELRDYQKRFISDVSLAHKAGHQGVIGMMPTGSGKTVCMARITKALADRSGKALIVVHRAELVTQTCKKLKLFGLPFGIIAAKFDNPNPSARIQVAMVMTISRRIDKGLKREFDYIIFDECHLAAAKSFLKIIARWPKARRLGLSATPWRLDGQGLNVVGSLLVKGPTITDLINLGSLVPFVTYSIPVVDLTGIKKVCGEYDHEEQAARYKRAHVIGDVIKHYFRLAKNRTTIVFASSVEHSQKLVEKFKEVGVRAEHIDGTTSDEDREAAVNRLKSGKTQVLCNYGCLTEGFDCERISAVIIARKTASSSLFRQMCGRGLRPHPPSDKKSCIILDHGGNAIDHGNIDYDYQFSLDGKKKNPSERICKVCKTCAAVCLLSAETCHVCGATFLTEKKERKIKQEDGELVALDSLFAPVEKKKKSNFRSRDSEVNSWLDQNGWG